MIQKRFRYVFVDEMQDMAGPQVDILNQLFHKKVVCRHVFQRIGDKNQAIYSGEIYLDEKWIDFGRPKTIRKSVRLSANIARRVEKLALEPCTIEGANKGSNEANIGTHIIVFDDASILHVIPRFCDLISRLKEDGLISNQERIFKAVGWIKEKDVPNRLGISHYFPGFDPPTAGIFQR